ncbi:MAG TPA: vWA domain-containing protein [Gemmataceae bacterium]|nr:vWA domain-containing protein [Gemmataceae bacterium]
MVVKGWSNRSFLLSGGLILVAILFVTILTNDYHNALREVERVGGSTDATSFDDEHCGPVRRVSLCGPTITDAELERVAPHLNQFPELFTLDLSMARVTDEGLGRLPGLNRLGDLLLRYTQVSDEHKEAAKVYIDYLRAKRQQVKAMKYGFRLADEKIPLDAPLDPAHGVNPEEPKKLMRVPTADVLEGVLGLWRKHKKPSRVVLVMDTSGSMQAMRKMESAQDAARELVEALSDRDQLSLLAFSDRLAWVHKEAVRMDAAGKKKATDSINDLVPRGETALYDAVASVHRYLLDNLSPGTISAVVVLTDGEDNKSRATLDEIEQIKTDFEKKTIRVFTIAYGRDTNETILKRIADATQAKEYKGDPKTILEVLKDIATFF